MGRMAANCKVSAARPGVVGGLGLRGVCVCVVGVYRCPRSVQCVFRGVFSGQGCVCNGGLWPSRLLAW